MEKKKRILLIDDNPGDAILLREALKRIDASISFEALQSGEDALKSMAANVKNNEETLPSLVILDLNMPGMNGIDVLTELKGSEEYRSIPVLIMTTSNLPSDIRTSYQKYANSVIVKPIEFDRYVEIIRSVIEYWFETVKLDIYE